MPRQFGLRLQTEVKMFGKVIRGIKAKLSPFAIRENWGMANDEIDRMDFLGGFEDPKLYEKTMAQIYADARNDDALALALKNAMLAEDVHSSFELFMNSSIPPAVSGLLKGYGLNSNIVDVGCGRGHGAYALYKNGFSNVYAMDPNSNYITGTGYLSGLKDHQINVINELSDWRAINSKFDAAISTATVHHWGHIPRAV